MIDFITYVVQELKAKRLSKTNALSLVQQFSSKTTKGRALHPLLQVNTSDLALQSYSSHFDGSEFFLNDHRVGQGESARKVLPGVAYLEMAAQAVKHALPDAQGVLQLMDVVWLSPIAVEDSASVVIALYASPDGIVEFEIFSDTQDEETLHCQGKAQLTNEQLPEALPIESIQTRADKGRLSAHQIYPAYQQMGVHFGPAHQGVDYVLQGSHEDKDELFAQLQLPSSLNDDFNQYLLHPSLLDSALQTAAGFYGDLSVLPENPSLPFALNELSVYGPCPKNPKVWVRHSQDGQTSDSVVKLDIDLCDEQGYICVALRGFTSRQLTGGIQAPVTRVASEKGCLLVAPVWQEFKAAPNGADFSKRLNLVVGKPNAQIELPDSHIIQGSDYADAAKALLSQVQTLLKSEKQGQILLTLVTPVAGPWLGLAGLLRTCALENPNVFIQVLQSDAEGAQLTKQLNQCACNGIVRFEVDKPKILHWDEVQFAQPPVAFKEQGVYLITGGLGGLGVLFAKEILNQSASAKIILTGRAPADKLKDKQLMLSELQGKQNHVEYHQLDITDEGAVKALVADIVKQHGVLSGVLHSAGMNDDSFIINKTEAQLDGVLAPKVVGTQNLDKATKDIDLDFIALFSSGAAVLGNPGQADYAMANGFMDQFAFERNRQVEQGSRKGHTLSINWPLWQEGGMRVDGATAERMFEATGMQPMPTAAGISAFYQALQLGLDQTLVMQGEIQRLKQALNQRKEPEIVAIKPQPVNQTEAQNAQPAVNLEAQTEHFIRKELSGLLKMAPNKIDPNAQLEQYGIDSILTMDLTNKLEKTFGSLSKTLFFEYQTINELTGYFLSNHEAVLSQLFADEQTQQSVQVTAPVAQVSKPVEKETTPAVSAKHRRKGIRFAAQAQNPNAVTVNQTKAEPIAIIGLSGRYPQGWDVNDYWQNLKNGKDCVTEVPKSRWDWQEYYSEDRNQPGCHYSKWGGFIEGVDEFDPLFFGIVPVGAEYLDPQERLFLQHAWMAIEDAGFTRARLQIPHEGDLAAQVGVYAGVMYGEYQLFGAQMSQQGNRLGFAGNPASIANRVSYVLNLHGPSMTVDTMCSSSLTAIHNACEDLNQGRTDLALAGGVNVSVHPNKYLMISAGQFISSEGQCQSFGEGGDGYIPAEGVGVVVLQRLSEAQANGQHIYGVIKGSALSHGGKTNGYTVPNPQAQSSAIRRALKAAEVDPRHVSYIEAHGTGTKLGDPIEIAALANAFKQTDTGFCKIGSAKSNVGHCEAAAGIAGLTKVLLQMRHGQVVPSLHSQKLNPHIDFDKTPFVVNQTLTPWQRPEVEGREIPRIAGISSFGAGGSNAHIVVEEYVETRAEVEHNGPVAIVLSARTQDQLRRKVADLNEFVDNEFVTMPSMAYTLQIGREAMDERLAILAASIKDLKQKLNQYLEGEVDIEDVFTGQVKRSKEEMALINADEDMKAAIDNWINRNKLGKLMELWAKGLQLDWQKLYPGEKPRLISLPTYPFARDRYWVDVEQVGNSISSTPAKVIHPLLHANTSDLSQQSYSTLLTGNEFFLKDHQVKQNKMLPAVAYLEMVRAAVTAALPESQDNFGIEIRNVVWAQPIVVNSAKTIHIALAPKDAQHIDFEVFSAVAEGRPQDVIHAQGQVRLVESQTTKVEDIKALQNQMSKGKPDPQRVYSAFAQMGIEYGPAYQAMTALSVGEGQLLAQLELPGSLQAELEQFALHPSLMDSALHASMGFSDDLEMQPEEPPLPFALDAIIIHAPCQTQMYSHVRFSADSSNEIVKLDIDLYDSKGHLCIEMQGFTSRELGPDEKGKQGLLLAEPVWQPAESVQAVEKPRQILLCGDWAFDSKQLQSLLPQSSIQVVADSSYETVAQQALHEVQAALSAGSELQIAIAPSAEQSLFAGISGLIKTAMQEQPGWVGQVLLSDAVDAKTLAGQLNQTIDAALVRYQNGQRQVQKWQALDSDDAQSIFNNDGVYVITGGLGGLGLLFCQEIITQAKSAKVILTGRSELDNDKSAKLAEFGDNVSCIQVDLDNQHAVSQAFDDIRSRFGKISGVLHSAGMTADNLIAKKTSDEVARVLAPKVQATRNIDAATAQYPLDFFVLFSSVSGAMGNVGQADYAMANGFMDQFAALRNNKVSKSERYGQTLSINWPLWAAGGMQLEAQAIERLERTTGATAMQTATGMSALNQALSSGLSQVLAMEGDIGRMLATLQRPEVQMPSQTVEIVEADSKTVGKARSYLSDLLAQLLKMPAHEIAVDAPLEDYGIDSILAMNLTHQLEQRFGSLSKTLFFEYQTLNQLAAYFAKNHTGHFAQTKTKPATGPVAEVKPTLATRQNISSIRDKNRFMAAQTANATQQVAIVGLAGRYPGADDVDSFWQNLTAGVDSVAEIPSDRWDHNRYFNPERNVPGTSYSRWGGFINDVDKFDPLFFNISPNEAKLIDPQERLFLQTAWHAMEDAGYSKTGLAGRKVGVYVGVMYGQYELYGAESIQSGQNEIATSSFASIANRVSYYFDFNGPSLALDTMCSSSLTALHLAAQGIERGELDAAIAGGVNLTIHPHKYLNLSQGNFVASDGRCRSFGAGGDGYVPGEGVGAVLLKPLNDALAEGDHIYGLVKASSLNHGGKTNGYTVPNPNAQGELILDALQQANIAPTTLGYLETHGTGTSLGDPIEITGLCKAFEGYAQDNQICPIGSVKSNIGHLESAAGIAALTKVLLQIQHGQLVPSLHAETLNPNIDFAATPFYVQREVAEFKRASEHPRRSGISSFGAGGANAHLIIEEYVDTRSATTATSDTQLFVLSANNKETLRQMARNTALWLAKHEGINFTDVVYTSQVGRTALSERLVIQCEDLIELKDKLNGWVDTQSGAGIVYGSVKKSSAAAASLIDGEAGELFMKTVMDSRDLAKISQLWISGVNIDWQQLYGNVQPMRLTLPLYPFAKERHWIAPIEQQNVVTQSASEIGLIHYAPVWKPAQLTANVNAASNIWLIGADEFDINGININAPAEQKAWQQVVADNSQNLPQQILFVASNDSDNNHDFYRLTYLVQTLMLAKHNGPVSLVCVANEHNPQHLALAALLKTLNLENPNYQGKLLIGADSAQIKAELSASTKGVEEIRYHGQQRLLKSLEALKPQIAMDAPLKQRGVYLITGGLGGLGLIFARHLAQHCQARLLLLGRSELNEAGNTKIAELEGLGAKVLYVPTDVAKLDSVKHACNQALEKFGVINGVIHSAGVNDDAFILNKNPEQLTKVVQAKVAGTINLDAATSEQPLDMFVLFSSVAGAMGNPGQCDYAYANAFMDAFAAKRSSERDGKSLSINWPLWAEGGMQLSEQDIARTEQHTGLRPLPVEQGIESFSQLLNFEGAQALSLYGDSQKIRRYFNGESVEVTQTTKAVVKTLAKTINPVVKGGDLKARTYEYLKSLVAEQTGLTEERIDVSEAFESFGFDSMMITRFNTQLEADLGALPKTLLYEHESIEALADYLLSSARVAVEAFFGAEASVESIEVEQTEIVSTTQPIIEDKPEPLVVVAAKTEEHVASVTEAVVSDVEETASRGIAIIGLDGRYPQSDDLDDYWQHLKNGDEMIAEVPANRWDADNHFDEDPANAIAGKIYSKWGGFVEDADKFDAEFFNINGLDAKLMDPQERLFLQSAWAVLEDAGYTKDSLKALYPKTGAGKAQSADVGVFVGITSNTYQMLANENTGEMLTPSAMPWSVANRVSYSLNLQGPSMPIDTACSSSLVALHMACESIRRKECALAIAGGVNLYLHQYKYQSLCNRQMLAKGNKTYSFGADGDGFVASEGVGCVLLKPLDKAIESRDHIYGVIAGSSYAHCGRANGYSAPNPTAQAQVIRDALADADVNPQNINYIEGHGTGTQLGDSLEIAAISSAFGGDLPEKFRCPVGSVKANIGHGESAAGIAGLTKVLLQLRHGQLAPSINCDPVNPNIDFANAPVRIQRKLSQWRAAKGDIRRAMINSFGAGGVNACVVVEQAPALPGQVQDDNAQLVVLSAKSTERLGVYAALLLNFIGKSPSFSLASLAFTLQVGREAMNERVAFVARDKSDLVKQLKTFIAGEQGEFVTGSLDPRRMRTGKTDIDDSSDLNTLAKHWCEGKVFDFELLHKRNPGRIALPSYPFKAETHWVEQTKTQVPSVKQSQEVVQSVPAQLHPLISHNASTLKSVNFVSKLEAQHWYAKDHQINGQALLPGAAMVEMANVAGSLAAEQRVAVIKDIVWVKPLVFTEDKVQTRLYLKTIGDATEVELNSLDEDYEPVTHFQAQLHFADSARNQVVPGSIDLTKLKEDAQQTIDGDVLYQRYQALGFGYGPAFKTVQNLYCHKDYALAELSLNQSCREQFDEYTLHPALLDGALQSVFGLSVGQENQGQNVPFALDELIIYRPLTANCFVHVYYVERPEQSRSGMSKFNIELLDENGIVLAALKHFYVRSLPVAVPDKVSAKR